MKENQMIIKKAAAWLLTAAMVLSVLVPAPIAKAAEQEKDAEGQAAAAQAERAAQPKSLEQAQALEVRNEIQNSEPQEKPPASAESVKLKKTAGVKTQLIGRKKIRISWNKVSGADGYEVHRYDAKAGRYEERAAAVKKTSFVDEKVTMGKRYTYKVKAYKKVDGKKVYGSLSEKNRRTVRPMKPGAIKNTPQRKRIALRWGKVSGADGYIVYRADTKHRKFKQIASVKSPNYTNKNLLTGKLYFYKVRAYEKDSSGKKVFSEATKVQRAKPKRPNVPYYSKQHKFYYKKKITVKAYAYSGGGRTALGTPARVGEIAVDPRVIPLGTNVYVAGYGYARAEDTGGNIKGRTVDLYMNSNSACYRWGVRYKPVYLGVIKA